MHPCRQHLRENTFQHNFKVTVVRRRRTNTKQEVSASLANAKQISADGDVHCQELNFYLQKKKQEW